VFFTLAVAIWANDVPYPPKFLSPTVTLTYPQVDEEEGVGNEATVKV
jgi:hypothetical protein